MEATQADVMKSPSVKVMSPPIIVVIRRSTFKDLGQ